MILKAIAENMIKLIILIIKIIILMTMMMTIMIVVTIMQLIKTQRSGKINPKEIVPLRPNARSGAAGVPRNATTTRRTSTACAAMATRKTTTTTRKTAPAALKVALFPYLGWLWGYLGVMMMDIVMV